MHAASQVRDKLASKMSAGVRRVHSGTDSASTSSVAPRFARRRRKRRRPAVHFAIRLTDSTYEIRTPVTAVFRLTATSRTMALWRLQFRACRFSAKEVDPHRPNCILQPHRNQTCSCRKNGNGPGAFSGRDNVDLRTRTTFTQEFCGAWLDEYVAYISSEDGREKDPSVSSEMIEIYRTRLLRAQCGRSGVERLTVIDRQSAPPPSIDFP